MTRSRGEYGGAPFSWMNASLLSFWLWRRGKPEVAVAPTVNHTASQCSLPPCIVSALFALLPMCQNGSHRQHATSLPWLLPLPVSFTPLSVSLPLTHRPSPLSHFVFRHQPLSVLLFFPLSTSTSEWFSACWICRAEWHAIVVMSHCSLQKSLKSKCFVRWCHSFLFSFYIILQKEKADTIILFLYYDKLEKSKESNNMTKRYIAFTVALFILFLSPRTLHCHFHSPPSFSLRQPPSLHSPRRWQHVPHCPLLDD